MAFKARFEIWQYNIIIKRRKLLKRKIDILMSVGLKMINVSRETMSRVKDTRGLRRRISYGRVVWYFL
jgi:hypothetical protein